MLWPQGLIGLSGAQIYVPMAGGRGWNRALHEACGMTIGFGSGTSSGKAIRAVARPRNVRPSGPESQPGNTRRHSAMNLRLRLAGIYAALAVAASAQEVHAIGNIFKPLATPADS